MICWAGNVLDANGRPRVVGPWSYGACILRRDDRFALHVAGQELDAGELAKLMTQIDDILKVGEDPRAILDLLRDTIRAVAVDRSTAERRRRATTVGRGIMSTCLPFATIGPVPIGGQLPVTLFIPDQPTLRGGFQVGPNRHMLASEALPTAATFAYTAPDADLGIWRGPTWTWPRGPVLTDFHYREDSAPWGSHLGSRNAWCTIAALAP
jgi:hypothetical protein